MHVIYFGDFFERETGGIFGSMVSVDSNGDPLSRVELADIEEAFAAGQSVTITPADAQSLAFAQEGLALFKKQIYMTDPVIPESSQIIQED